MKRLRIVLVALHFAEYAAKLADALKATCDVMLVLYRENTTNELASDWQVGARIQLLVLDDARSLGEIVSNSRKLKLAIEQFEPDAVHYQEGIRDELVWAMVRCRRYPAVLTVHDPTPHSGADSIRMRFSRYRVYRTVVRRLCTAAIAHGSALVLELEKDQPHLKGRVFAIPHGPLGEECTVVRRSPPPPGIRLLFFGRINEYKGLPYFVEAVVDLRRRGYDVVGVVAGRGTDLERHRARMVDAGCFEVLDKYIPATEVPPLFVDARAVVLPYIDGTQSGVAAMALGYGKPVVATRVGSIPELVRDGINGLLVAPRDQDALNEALRKIVIDDELCASLGSGARTLQTGELSWANIASSTELVYRRAIESRQRESGR